jgi:lysine 2,3-aminomutase
VPPAARRSRGNTRTRDFRRRFFPQATEGDWNDWRWQSRNRIRKLDQIDRMLILSDDEREALL